MMTHVNDKASDLTTEVRSHFACELEKFKQANLMDQVLSHDKGACLFSDVTTITDNVERNCVVHGKSGKICDACLHLHCPSLNCSQFLRRTIQKQSILFVSMTRFDLD